MAHGAFDRIKETATTTGTGNFTLGGAVTKFLAFSTRFANNDRVFYVIEHQSANEWEVGLGTWTTGSVLVRDTVLASSNSDGLVDFSSGTKHVWCDFPAMLNPHANELTVTPSANQNNYDPTGLKSTAVLRVNQSASILFSGLAGGWHGRLLTVVNASTDYVLILTHQDANSTAANRFDLQRGALFLLPGDSITLRYDGNDSRWKVNSSNLLRDSFDPLKCFHIVDDFLGGAASSGNYGACGWTSIGSGTGNAINYLGSSGPNDVIGALELVTGTTTTGRAAIRYGSGGTATIEPLQGFMLHLQRVWPTTLSDGTNTYRVTSGFHDGDGAGEPVDGYYWEYDSPTSTAWRTVTSDTSTRTKKTSGLTVATTPQWLGVFVNAAGTRADFFRSSDGNVWTFETSHSTGGSDNMPDAAERFAATSKIEKSAGTTARQLNFDLIEVLIATPRDG